MSSKEHLEELLSPRHRRFALNYVSCNRNGTQAYRIEYPDCSYSAAAVAACELLKNPNIQSYIYELEREKDEERALLSILVARKKRRLVKIADSSMELSTRMLLILSHKVPLLQDKVGVNNISIEQMEKVTRVKNMLERSMNDVGQMLDVIIGADAIAEEICNKIKKDEWYKHSEDLTDLGIDGFSDRG